MTQASQPTSRIFNQDLWNGLQNGVAAMLVQAPGLNTLNHIGTVSCRDNLTFRLATSNIWRGIADAKGGTPPIQSWRNMVIPGLDGHLAKESARVFVKSVALLKKPALDDHFGKPKADLVFAGGLSLAEIGVNPFDTLRVMWQANARLSDVEKGQKITQLFKGSSANVVRAFAVWYFYIISERNSSQFIRQFTSIDPDSPAGICLKALPISAHVTTFGWLLERVKNELQMRLELTKDKKSPSQYWTAAKHIMTTQGMAGFGKGASAKFWYYAFQSLGASWLLAKARQAHAAKAAQKAG